MVPHTCAPGCRVDNHSHLHSNTLHVRLHLQRRHRPGDPRSRREWCAFVRRGAQPHRLRRLLWQLRGSRRPDLPRGARARSEFPSVGPAGVRAGRLSPGCADAAADRRIPRNYRAHRRYETLLIDRNQGSARFRATRAGMRAIFVSTLRQARRYARASIGGRVSRKSAPVLPRMNGESA